MRKENFGMFLNEWGRALSRYSSAVVKFVEKDGELHRMVVPWQTIICDSVDFENNPVIEVLDLTEAQLRQRKGYDKDMVEALCDAKTVRKLPDGTNKDNKSDYIRIYELHAELELSELTEDPKDDDVYVPQMWVMSFTIKNDERTGAVNYNDYTLAKGQEKRSPYLLTHLIKEEGRTLGIGPVESLFDAQWMMNHSTKQIKDQLDLASKLIFQTSDGSFVGQNALSAVETGDILIHKLNEPLTTLANSSHDVTSLQNFGNFWKQIGNEIVGRSESMLGNAAPSGTAWRQVEALLQESHDLFELMRENKGLYIEEMFREFVIPFVKKQMDNDKEIAATLEAHDISRIDAMYIKNFSTKLVNDQIKKTILSGGMPTPEDQALLTQKVQGSIQDNLQQQGNQRFFKPDEIKTWKEQFKDLEWEVEVDVTGENVDKNAVTTLNTMLTTLAKNPGLLQDPNIKMLWNKILSQTGVVSPLEISSVPSPLSLSSIPSATPVLSAPTK
jgi:hypothetical protein